jgi:UV DNA damage endonuclease
MSECPSNFNLGYACINTVLQKKKITSSKTLRLATLEKKGVGYAKELAIQNLKNLLLILKWNKENNILFFRMSSEMFPFATYKGTVNGEPVAYSLDFADDLLKEIGQYARDNKMRLTMHPSQFCVLSSKDSKIVENTFSDLNHHCDIMDRMGLDHNSVIIIHGGGVYGNKKEALKRLEENIMSLPKNTRNRLVLENCEMAYTIEDLIPLSEKLQIPLIIDFHHDDINPCSKPIENYFERVFKVWFDRGIKPKVHVSNSIPGITKNHTKTEQRKHSDYISYIHNSLLLIDFPIDIMLECKMKEDALLNLRKNGFQSYNSHDNDLNYNSYDIDFIIQTYTKIN